MIEKKLKQLKAESNKRDAKLYTNMFAKVNGCFLFYYFIFSYHLSNAQSSDSAIRIHLH